MHSENVADEPEESARHDTSPVRQLYLAEGILEKLPGGWLRLTARLGRLLFRLITSHLDDYFAGRDKVASLGHRDTRHSAAF